MHWGSRLNFNDKISNVFCQLKDGKQDLLVDDQHRIIAQCLPWLYILIIGEQLLFGPMVMKDDSSVFLLVFFVLLSIFCILRAVYWKAGRKKFSKFSLKRKKLDLISVSVMSIVITLFFSVLAARWYLETREAVQLYVSFSVLVLSVVGAFALYVLPVASFSIIICSSVPVLYALVTTGNPYLISLASVGAATTIFAGYLLTFQFKNFAELVLSRHYLQEEKRASQRVAKSVERLAFYDALTDLPNRRKFVTILAECQEATEKGAPGFAVGVIDITGFKAIDDAYGRVAGDVLLRQVASRLKGISEKYGKAAGAVARLGDDEFVLIAPGVENVIQAEEFGRLLSAELQQNFELSDTQVHLSFTCGFALFPYSDSDSNRLIARADLARRGIVGQGRDVVGVFSIELELGVLRNTKVKQALREALDKQEIEPWFQPIVRIEDGDIVGFESLARWYDPKLGHVSPTEFVEIAEQSQLIEKLSLDLFRKSLDVAKCWSADTKLFYNLSAKLLGRQKSIEKMLTILEQSGFPPWRLEIELTETAVMDDLELAKLQMQKFKDAGVGIALDDFGSGYSSLGQIRDLPLDKVKIDKSFTDQICTDVKIRHIVQALIQLCRQIDIICVVEGVEDLEQLGLLSDMGCELGQGYLFSKPIPASKTSRRVLLVNAA